MRNDMRERATGEHETAFIVLSFIISISSLLLILTSLCEHDFCFFTHYNCGTPQIVVINVFFLSHLLSPIMLPLLLFCMFLLTVHATVYSGCAALHSRFDLNPSWSLSVFTETSLNQYVISYQCLAIKLFIARRHIRNRKLCYNLNVYWFYRWVMQIPELVLSKLHEMTKECRYLFCHHIHVTNLVFQLFMCGYLLKIQNSFLKSNHTKPVLRSEGRWSTEQNQMWLDGNSPYSLVLYGSRVLQLLLQVQSCTGFATLSGGSYTSSTVCHS